MNVSQNLIEAMIEEFKKYPSIEKVVLFGSRARGDNRERSDYDIAVFGSLSQEEISRIKYFLNNETPTLLNIDISFMKNVKNERLKQEIEIQGVILYDKNGK